MSMRMELTACCKINIGLDIPSRRPDGYHEIETLMYPLGTPADRVEVVSARAMRFAAQGIPLDCPPQDNLALRAARLMHERYGAGPVSIRLEKHVPFGAGLGGGSSDAAAVIRACNLLFGLGLTTERMEAAAAELGSDTAFFIRSQPALCTGRGEKVQPYPLDLRGLAAAIAVPAAPVGTAEAYRRVRPRPAAAPLTDRLKLPLQHWRTEIGNAFEQALFPDRPDLKRLKEKLYCAGAVYASLSGSGSAVYGLFGSEPPLAAADLFPDGDGRLFLCRL